ncbi:MAG: hypothetical protein NBV67_15135 [Tagaea sp.]|nr:hypothetical protein [Tagaea sp.]
MLHALAGTPQLQRAFFGGPVIETAPFGVFEHDGPRRYEQAMRTKPWEPKDPAAQAPAQSDIRDMAWRPGRDGEAQPMPLPHKIRTPEEKARDIVPISYDTRAGTQAPVHDDGMLDPAKWPEHLRAQGQATDDEPQEEVEIESAATATDYADDDPKAIEAAQAQQPQPQPAHPPQPAAAQAQRNPANIDRYFDDLDKRVQELAKRWNTDPNYIHAILSLESGWFDEKARARNNPLGYTVQPNSEAARTGQQAGLPTQLGSLDRAFQQWSDKWGPRIRESENIHDFLENIQLGGTGMYNSENSVHNTNRIKVD